MAGFRQNAIKTYANVSFESEVNSADPHQLITLVFDGILNAISQAQVFMASNDIEKKNSAISKATILIDSGLRAGLNFEQGGELANNLDDLYRFMLNRLMLSHLNNDTQLLIEVQTVVEDIRQAWIAISPELTQNQELTTDRLDSFMITT